MVGRCPVAAALKDYEKTDNPHPIFLVPEVSSILGLNTPSYAAASRELWRNSGRFCPESRSAGSANGKACGGVDHSKISMIGSFPNSGAEKGRSTSRMNEAAHIKSTDAPTVIDEAIRRSAIERARALKTCCRRLRNSLRARQFPNLSPPAFRTLTPTRRIPQSLAHPLAQCA